MTAPRWTLETAELVSAALMAAGSAADKTCIHANDPDHDEHVMGIFGHGGVWGFPAALTQVILAALADAGLLLPRDTDRDQQRGVLNTDTGQVSRCWATTCAHSDEERTRERVRTFVSFTTPWIHPKEQS